MTIAEESLQLHYDLKGKLDVVSKVPVRDSKALSLAYTPGVAEPCLKIKEDINKSYELTGRSNMCLVVTDGTAVLGLGDIGPEAGMPVMEGKCVLFKEFGNVNAFPLCIKSKDVDEIVRTIYLIQEASAVSTSKILQRLDVLKSKKNSKNYVIFRYSTMTSMVQPSLYWQVLSMR